jgi:uncharacterized membrane protein YgdD (TMEM256/DUF423 family)
MAGAFAFEPSSHRAALLGPLEAKMARWWLLIGSVAGFLGVAGGAFGAHALKARISEQMLANFDTGTRYLLVHAVALLVVGVLSGRDGVGNLTTVGSAFTVGMVIFTGSLWLMALTGTRWLGAITPIGGTALLVGWVALGLAAARGQLGS